MNALRLSFGLLTVVPVGRLPRFDRGSAGAAMLLAPLTTVPVLVLLAAARLLVDRTPAPPLLAAALLLAGAALLTRGLHLDGLADTADGLASGASPERTREVMKASDIGPAGVATLALLLLVQAAALTALLTDRDGVVLAGVGWLVSRQALAWCCLPGVRPAASDGLGARVAGTVSVLPAGFLLALLLVLAGLVPAAWGSPWWPGPVTALAGLLAGMLLLWHAVRRVGGVTGDVLGAVVETTLAAALVAAVLVG